MSQPVKGMERRYEFIRSMCKRAGDFHPDDKSPCHKALQSPRARGLPTIAHALAEVLDDAMLLIRHLDGPTRSGVFWLSGPSREYRVLVDEVERTDYQKIYNEKMEVGVVIHGLTFDQLCNVKIQRIA